MNRSRLMRRFHLADHDGWFVAAVVVLCLLGTIAVYGAGSFRPEAHGQYHYLVLHLQRLAIGLMAALVLANVDHVLLRRSWVAWGAMLAGVTLTGLPVAMREFGIIDRWIEIRGVGQFQPIELAKLALVLFLAYRLSAPLLDRPLSWRQLGITLAVGPLPLMLILALQPNFGNVVVMGLVTALMLLLAGLAWRWFAAAVPAVVALVVLGYHSFSKLQLRIDAWWEGWQGRGLDGGPAFGYQVHQSLLGMGAGGWHGLGPGNSHNKFAFLPENHTDFAISFLGEELGLIGTVVVVAALLILAWRALVIAERAPGRFGRLLVVGLGGMLFIYGAANIAMVTGVIPVMGVPLPYVSYGGSALVTNLAAVGLILNVDRQGRRRRPLGSRRTAV